MNRIEPVPEAARAWGASAVVITTPAPASRRLPGWGAIVGIYSVAACVLAGWWSVVGG